MIYTITPNPSLDLGGLVEELVPNEKSYVHDETRFPGGNAINAARIIKKFNQPVIASGFLGGGIGREVESLLKREGVRCQFIQIKGHTRISLTVSDQNTHLQTRLSFPGPKISSQEIKSLAHWVKSISSPALIVMGGSLPPGFSVTHLKQMIQIAHEQSIPCIVDVPGKPLKELIESRPLLIKPNLMEFRDLVGKKVTTIQEVTKAAKKINQKVPLICISSVEGGALLVTPEKVWFGKTPPIRVKTTVGAGDSMVGAMSAQIWKQKIKTFEGGGDLLRWGLAAAAATLITPGTTLGEYKKMTHFYPLVKITEVI
jgi:1-phosphofructokinase family hexose kinase